MFYFIQQGEWDNNHLRFMYLPVIHTLTNLENDVANITRAAVEAHLRTRNMSLFSERFDARTILQKAGLVPEVYR